ncbi:hypothetical protein LTR08_004896 [Meristemomyces frigidus]|nr:hypothetical protein LTR08_004896 [Meristemomyces frigidus]
MLLSTLALALPLLAAAQGTWPTDLVGTWSTKSNSTLTGPAFYDPLNDKLLEPALTGISYSFTADGHFEEAYYRAVANPQNPACPSGIMQWQHGAFEQNTNGSLTLTPIAVDGRQLLSSPCDYDKSVYTRYNQSEQFLRYSAYTDPYHNIPRLDLYKFDGSPMNPMYLALTPPQMLPTTTLNPTTVASTSTPTSTSTTRKPKQRRDLPLTWAASAQAGETVLYHINAERLWWVGLAMTGVGGLLYLGPRRMGVQL